MIVNGVASTGWYRFDTADGTAEKEPVAEPEAEKEEEVVEEPEPGTEEPPVEAVEKEETPAPAGQFYVFIIFAVVCVIVIMICLYCIIRNKKRERVDERSI